MRGTIIYDNPNRLIDWASVRLSMTPFSDVHAIGWERDGELRAVAMWDRFAECDCQMHIASDLSRTWLSRAFLKACFMHPFVQWRLQRVTGLVASRNADALRFDEHLGFKREGLIKHGLPDDDLVLLGMLREDCRWIPQKFRGHHE